MQRYAPEDNCGRAAYCVPDEDGEYVLHSEAQAEIARLQAEVERLRGVLRVRSVEADTSMYEAYSAHNAAIEQAATLFTHPDEEGIADRIRDLKR